MYAHEVLIINLIVWKKFLLTDSVRVYNTEVSNEYRLNYYTFFNLTKKNKVNLNLR